MSSNREIVERFLHLVNNERRVRQAFEECASEDYVQHNPTLQNGRESAIALIEAAVATPGCVATIKRIIAEGDFVVSHMHVTFGGTIPDWAVVDIWRIEDGKLAEHWDVIQEVPPLSASGNSMV
jgi:predicted SnoaL-like aldol condensation-catalyzing enzyme